MPFRSTPDAEAPDPGTAARILRPLVAWLTFGGHDAQRVLRDAGVPVGAVVETGVRIPTAAWLATWDLAGAVDRDAGLRVAELTAQLLATSRPPPDQSAALVLYTAPTVGEALAHLGPAQRLTTPSTDYELVGETAGGRRVRLRHRGPPLPRACVDFLVAWPVLTLRALAASGPFAPRVALPYPEPAALATHQRLLGDGVRFGAAEASFLVAPAEWRTPLRTADPALFATVVARGSEAATGGVVPRVVALLADIEGVLPSAEEAARRLAMSPRSLRRALAEAGSSYRALLDDALRDRARALLARGMDLEKAATALGYSDARALRRAMKRWEE